MTSCPSTCPRCGEKIKNSSLNSIRAHLSKAHNINAESAYLLFKEHPGPCTQCAGPVKFMSFQTGYERLCGTCNKKNSQLRGAAVRKGRHHVAWNKGLTKETSDAVKRAGDGCRNFIAANGHWRTGKTKENDPSVARAAEAISISLSEKWKSERHWTQHGNTSLNDERIKRRSATIADGVRANHWSRRPAADVTKKKIVETRKRLIAEGVNSPFRLSENDIAERVALIKETWNVDEFTFNGHTTPINVSCPTCGLTASYAFNSLYKGKVCPSCHPANYSRWHRELYEYFLTLDQNATVNDRTVIPPLELDVVSGDRRFAVECNGLYWHSEAMGVSHDYHQSKTTMSAASNVSLLHVFEDEWNDDLKREIIKSMVAVKLGRASKIMARKTSLRTGHPANVASFLTTNHLDGNTPASKAFWLVDDTGSIVVALTLRKPHQQARWGSKTIELARVATVLNTVVVGGMSKLIHAAIDWSRMNGFEKMITYRDMRLGGNGAAYEASGFGLSHVTEPRFWWTNCRDRFDRFLIRAIPGIATQEEMATEHRMFKIHGCSNAVYVMDVA